MSRYILASQSPRRKQLLTWADIEFDIIVSAAAEDYPSDMDLQEVPVHIAQKKAIAVQDIAAIKPFLPFGVSPSEYLDALNMPKREPVQEAYKGKRTNDGAPGTFKAKITKAYGGDVTIEKARKFKSRENATPHDKRQANWFINFHSKNENLEPSDLKNTEKSAPYGSEYRLVEEQLAPYIKDLTKYMYNQGLTIDPAPEIEFVEDEDNAKNPLGKTAHYDPNQKLIVLYTTGRNPKDILRSFAHEMIHHVQNLEGRLGNIHTTNVNEDDFLKALEREAYERGNMSFRSWENSLRGDNGVRYIKGFVPRKLKENLISETMTVYRLGEIPNDEESFFVTPDYKTWIKFYPGEEIHKITTNKLYLPLRSKSFSSWDELRSKYNSGEFTDDDVSYINPEESGIQDFEQYEIKPDDIIDLEQINLEEGRKKKPDPRKGTGKKPEKSGRRLYTDEDPKDTVSIKFKTKEDIVDTLNKTSFKAKSHARQSQVINLIHQRVRAAYGKSKDPEVRSRLKRALDYIEKRKEMSKKKTERLNKMKESSDPFGLNELARQFVNETLIETWNPEESFVSLSRYMIDNGMNIKPLPKIKVIKDDEENASLLLGKTAYYDPNNQSITLYTMNRHPKDVLRSFAHEMVHHEQNLEGRLNNINTTNTNEDGDLPEIEKEAYEKGNMMLRNWEDSIKNV